MFFFVRHASRADFSISCGWRGGASCQDGWIRMAGKAAWNILCCILGIPDFFLSTCVHSLFPAFHESFLLFWFWSNDVLSTWEKCSTWNFHEKSVAPSQYRHHLLKECNAHATTTRCTCQVKTIHLKPGLWSLQWLRLPKDFTKHKENGGKTTGGHEKSSTLYTPYIVAFIRYIFPMN